MGENETVEHVILEYEKYGEGRTEMVWIILPELGCKAEYKKVG